MSDRQGTKALLDSCRILELAGDKGFLCGKVFGDLGADVIKIEPPRGDPARNIGPFYHNIPDPEKSLYWFAFNNNKRGITLNIETRDGQEIFKRLVKTADFVIESFVPGYIDGLGLGYSALSKINPRIIMTSITPFGQTGPYKDYKASDIVCMAIGGMMHGTGDPDRPPVRISVPQAYLLGGAQATAATMVAYHFRETTGEGQHVDVSIQESLTVLASGDTAKWVMGRAISKRAGLYERTLRSGIAQRQLWPCKDGYVSFFPRSAPMGTATNQALAEWINSKGLATEFIRKIDWRTFDLGGLNREEFDLFEGPIARLFMTHTRAELYREALARRIQLYPVLTPDETAESYQLQARDYWVQVDHPELNDTLTYPGSFIKASETPCSIRRRAPLIGEHNVEIYCQELGFSNEELVNLKRTNVI